MNRFTLYLLSEDLVKIFSRHQSTKIPMLAAYSVDYVRRHKDLNETLAYPTNLQIIMK